MGKVVIHLSLLFLFIMIYFYYYVNDEDDYETSKLLITNSDKVVLSQNASFPTPVIQLQQELAQGLTGREQRGLPEINKDLAELSQESIDNNSLPPPLPAELEKLKKQLKKLQLYSQQK